MPKASSAVVALFIVLASISAGDCAPAPGKLFPKLSLIPVCPVLATVARTNGVPTTGMDPSLNTNLLHSGDSVTLLGTIFQKKSQSQWLLYVEAEAPAAKPDKIPPPMVVNLFGTPMSFESKPVPAKLRMLGPFTVSDTQKQLKSGEQKAEFSLNESFLGVGLEQAAAVIWRRNQLKKSENSTPRNGPVFTNQTSRTQNPKAEPKLTLEEQRAISGLVPALMSYFEIVQHTEGLESLLFKLVKLPSVWSMVRHVGVTAGINFGHEAFPANPADWNLPPSAPVYYLPCMLRLNDQPALKITFVVTSPSPPLLTCGGVVGLLAEKVGDDETYMTLRVVSAKCKTEQQGERNR